MAATYPEAGQRRLVTASVTISTLMVTLDGTIANIALPHIQSSVSASPEQVIWVLTSYLVATAIATPLSGWLAQRYGRKRVMMISIAGFTLASAGCGAATGLYELVLYRLIQGLCGAGLVPLSQATLLDINPPERHGQAMSTFGVGSLIGPVIGPVIGGWLTDVLNWRWIFLINVPLGLLAAIGLSLYSGERRTGGTPKFDMMGFLFLSLFLGSFQLMLDRGQQLDWFSSTEICLEAGAAAMFAYLTVVHLLTVEDGFIRPELFKDRNFALGCIIGGLLGVLVYAAAPIVTIMTQQLFGYPVITAGLISAPRGIGAIVTMALAGRLLGRVDARLVVIVGLLLSAYGVRMIYGLTLDADASAVTMSNFVQGAGSGMLFVALSFMVFNTIKPQLRNEGAAMYSLIRSLGAAMGISMMQTLLIRSTATAESRLVEGVRPDNPVLDLRMPDLDFDAPASVGRLAEEVYRQATMIGYIDIYWLLFVSTLCMIPLALMLKSPRPGAVGDQPLPALD